MYRTVFDIKLISYTRELLILYQGFGLPVFLLTFGDVALDFFFGVLHIFPEIFGIGGLFLCELSGRETASERFEISDFPTDPDMSEIDESAEWIPSSPGFEEVIGWAKSAEILRAFLGF